MPWNTISIDDIYLTPQEQAALNLIQGSAARLPKILADVVKSVRGFCIAGGNQLDEDGTIPDQLKNIVSDIARWRFLTSFPQLKLLQTKDRKDAYDDGMKMLTEIASGKIKVELPAAGTAQNNPSPANSIQQVSGIKCRQLTRDRTKGL